MEYIFHMRFGLRTGRNMLMSIFEYGFMQMSIFEYGIESQNEDGLVFEYGIKSQNEYGLSLFEYRLKSQN